jgi:FkbM family methyltransferase
MKNLLKRIAARLPKRVQLKMKRAHFGLQLRRSRFDTDEPEYALLSSFLSPGDWGIDVGANVGHYTARMSALVGKTGRVIAFEPVLDTFGILTTIVGLLPAQNVTLINAAASDAARMTGMTIPSFSTGLQNYCQARVSDDGADTQVLCVSVDSMAFPHPVRLVKIDAEGHELSVLKGMQGLLRRDHPALIIEDTSAEVPGFLENLGYVTEKIDGSSNRMYRWGPGKQG